MGLKRETEKSVNQIILLINIFLRKVQKSNMTSEGPNGVIYI